MNGAQELGLFTVAVDTDCLEAAVVVREEVQQQAKWRAQARGGGFTAAVEKELAVACEAAAARAQLRPQPAGCEEHET